jgi:deoxyribose-phosphate aldolase
MIGLIDLTDLADDRSPSGIDDLCRRAAEHRTAAVCVWPLFVGRCVEALAETDVRVATVVNFPSGDERYDEVVGVTETALIEGAVDIDLVLPYRALLAGDTGRAEELVADVDALVGSERLLKVILETGALPDADAIGAAARLAIDSGADFVKTSTGKLATGATIDAARVMLVEIAAAAEGGRTVGLKPSGGIRTFADAVAYLDLAESVMGAGWAVPRTFRFGASGLLAVLLAEIEGSASDAVEQAGY